MTRAVDSRNYEMSKILLEYAAKNSLLRDKSIPIKAKSTRIEKKLSRNGHNSVEELTTGSNSHDAAPVSFFDCSVSQIYQCGQKCHVLAQEGVHHRQFMGTIKQDESSEILSEKPFYHFHVLEEDVVNPFESAFYTREEVANPLLRACLNDDYEMIVLFLQYGFVIWDPERVSDNARSSFESLFHPKISQEGYFYPYHPNNDKDWFQSFACQRALCAPSYINLTESQTVMRCLELASRFKLRARCEVDYREVFQSLMDKCVSYATELLDVCRDDGVYDGDGDDPAYAAQEVYVLLGSHHAKRKDMLSPMINTAMNRDIVDFYTHDECYKFIEKMWNPVESMEKKKIAINDNQCKHLLDQFFLMIQLTVLTLGTFLISPLLYFFQQPYCLKEQADSVDLSWRYYKEKGSQLLSKMATARNSYAGSIHFYIIFCVLLLVEVQEYSENVLFSFCPMPIYSWLTLVCTVAMFFQLIEMMLIKKSAFWKDFWSIYSAVNVVLFMASYVIWFYATHFGTPINDSNSTSSKLLSETECELARMGSFSSESENELWPGVEPEACFKDVNMSRRINTCKPIHSVYWNQKPKFYGKDEEAIRAALESMNLVDWKEALVDLEILPIMRLILQEENIFKVAIFMYIGRFAHVFKFHKALSMMNLMMLKTINLITYFAIILFMYAFCFAICIKMTYVNYQGMWQITLDPLTNLPVCQQMTSKYASLTETLLTLFWDLFGKGEVDDLEIFLPNLRKPKKQSSDPDEFLDPENMHRFREMLCKPDLDKADFLKIMAMDPLNYEPEDVENDFNFAPNTPVTSWMGELFLGLYNVFAVIVMLNLLIALMTNGFEKGKR